MGQCCSREEDGRLVGSDVAGRRHGQLPSGPMYGSAYSGGPGGKFAYTADGHRMQGQPSAHNGVFGAPHSAELRASHRSAAAAWVGAPP